MDLFKLDEKLSMRRGNFITAGMNFLKDQ